MPAPEELLESPSPSRNPFGLGFRPPASPEEHLPPSPLPSPASSPEETLEVLEAELASGDEWPDSDPESLDGTPSPGSTRESDGIKVEILTTEELETMARAGVAAAGEKAHDLFATSDGQRQVGLYLTDPVDQASIGDPLARIAGRHQGAVGKVNPDTKDMLSALVALVGYGTKQMNRRAEARALDAGASTGQRIPEPVDL